MINCYDTHEALVKQTGQRHEANQNRDQNQQQQQIPPEVHDYFTGGQCLDCKQQLVGCLCIYQQQSSGSDFYHTQTTRDSGGSSADSSPASQLSYSRQTSQRPAQQQQQQHLNSSQISACANQQATQPDQNQNLDLDLEQHQQSHNDELYERLYACGQQSDSQWAGASAQIHHLDFSNSQQQTQAYRTQQNDSAAGATQENLKSQQSSAATNSGCLTPSDFNNNQQNQDLANGLSFAPLVPINQAIRQPLELAGPSQPDQRTAGGLQNDELYNLQQQHYTSGAEYAGCYGAKTSSGHLDEADEQEADKRLRSPCSSSSAGSLARATSVEQNYINSANYANYQLAAYSQDQEHHNHSQQQRQHHHHNHHLPQQATSFQDYYNYPNCDSTLTSGGGDDFHPHQHLQQQQQPSHSFHPLEHQQFQEAAAYLPQFLDVPHDYDGPHKTLYQLTSSEPPPPPPPPPPPLQQHQLAEPENQRLPAQPTVCSSSSSRAPDCHQQEALAKPLGGVAETQSGSSRAAVQTKLGATGATPSRSRRGRPRKKGSHSKGKVSGKLWEFIRDLLLSERTNPSFIRWERREDGVFKFVQSDKVAKLWGERKQNPKMTYEKLSRAMRYYYKSKVLLPVFGRRLVYKFGPNATGWMSLTGNTSACVKAIASGAAVAQVCANSSAGSTVSTSSSVFSTSPSSSSADSSPSYNLNHLNLSSHQLQVDPLQQQSQQQLSGGPLATGQRFGQETIIY